MGGKHIKNFKQKFLEKGLIPLEPILDAKQKVRCIDFDGYKYFLSYHGSVGDKRTKTFDKWDKTNPFKAYNMRLYARSVQDNVQILSTDAELFEASTKRIKFICPCCHKEYTKKWCHWIAMPYNHHFCPECNDNPISSGYSQISILTENWLKEHNMSYIREYLFKDCKDKNVLRFDFGVTYQNNLYLIEVDGAQHYYAGGWTTKERLEEVQKHDKIKTEYCLENGYVLIRLPFWVFKKDSYIKKLNEIFFG